MIKIARVTLRDRETLDDLILRFKRVVNRDGVLSDIKKHEYYLKPGVKKRLRREENRRKRLAKKTY